MHQAEYTPLPLVQRLLTSLGFPFQRAAGLIPMPNDWECDWIVSDDNYVYNTATYISGLYTFILSIQTD